MARSVQLQCPIGVEIRTADSQSDLRILLTVSIKHGLRSADHVRTFV